DEPFAAERRHVEPVRDPGAEPEHALDVRTAGGCDRDGAAHREPEHQRALPAELLDRSSRVVDAHVEALPARDPVANLAETELWAKPIEKLGFVPNVLRVYAIRPRHLELWNAFYDDLMRGESGLTKAQREMIAVVVSAANRCHYCIVSHSAALRKLTGDAILVEQLASNYTYAKVEPKERAMLDFAVKLTERSSSCTETDV